MSIVALSCRLHAHDNVRGGSKLAELMPNHIFSDKHRDVLTAVMHLQASSQHISGETMERRDHVLIGRFSLVLDGYLHSSSLECKIDKWTFFQLNAARVYPPNA